jgi:hypothetical protein
MKRKNLFFISLLSILILLIAYILLFGRYRGVKPGNIGNYYGERKVIPVSDIVGNARSLEGILYDFSMGSLNNKLSDFGFIVCADLIDISFSKSGYPLENRMKEDFIVNRKSYNTENGVNNLDTKYFYRRSRNIKQFCINNGFYIEHCTYPLPGDIIFYGDYHVALVTSSLKNGYIKQIEALPNQIMVMELKKKWNNNPVGRIRNCF